VRPRKRRQHARTVVFGDAGDRVGCARLGQGRLLGAVPCRARLLEIAVHAELSCSSRRARSGTGSRDKSGSATNCVLLNRQRQPPRRPAPGRRLHGGGEYKIPVLRLGDNDLGAYYIYSGVKQGVDKPRLRERGDGDSESQVHSGSPVRTRTYGCAQRRHSKPQRKDIRPRQGEGRGGGRGGGMIKYRWFRREPCRRAQAHARQRPQYELDDSQQGTSATYQTTAPGSQSKMLD